MVRSHCGSSPTIDDSCSSVLHHGMYPALSRRHQALGRRHPASSRRHCRRMGGKRGDGTRSNGNSVNGKRSNGDRLNGKRINGMCTGGAAIPRRCTGRMHVGRRRSCRTDHVLYLNLRRRQHRRHCWLSCFRSFLFVIHPPTGNKKKRGPPDTGFSYFFA